MLYNCDCNYSIIITVFSHQFFGFNCKLSAEMMSYKIDLSMIKIDVYIYNIFYIYHVHTYLLFLRNDRKKQIRFPSLQWKHINK